MRRKRDPYLTLETAARRTGIPYKIASVKNPYCIRFYPRWNWLQFKTVREAVRHMRAMVA